MQGVYTGVFAGQNFDNDPHIWVVSRPSNWQGATSSDWLLRLDGVSGVELSRTRLNSQFTQDAVRIGKHVWVCNTGQGEILQFELEKSDLKPLRTHRLFTPEERVNNIAALDINSIWVISHYLGDVCLPLLVPVLVWMLPPCVAFRK